MRSSFNCGMMYRSSTTPKRIRTSVSVTFSQKKDKNTKLIKKMFALVVEPLLNRKLGLPLSQWLAFGLLVLLKNALL